MTEAVKTVGNRFYKLINNEVVFGNVDLVQTENGTEILIKKPFTILGDRPIPYMGDKLPNSPAAIQIHPINVLWAVPLNEFPDLEEIYIKKTTDLEIPDKPSIILG